METLWLQSKPTKHQSEAHKKTFMLLSSLAAALT